MGDARVRRGEWVRAAPSVYLSSEPTLLDRLGAGTRHGGPGSVITGWAGCVLHGQPYVDDRGAVDVLVPPTRTRTSTAWVRILPTTRRPCWTLVHGLRVAPLARCVVDAARALSQLREVRALVLQGVAKVPVAVLAAELEAGARGGRALVQRALLDARRGAASAPEAELVDELLRPGVARLLPPFLLNPDLYLHGVFLARPDGWCVGLGLGWEVESRRHHAGLEEFDATVARLDRVVVPGLALLHTTPRRLRKDPAAFPALLLAALAGDRGAEPAGLVVRARGPLLSGPRRKP